MADDQKEVLAAQMQENLDVLLEQRAQLQEQVSKAQRMAAHSGRVAMRAGDLRILHGRREELVAEIELLRRYSSHGTDSANGAKSKRQLDERTARINEIDNLIGVLNNRKTGTDT